MIPYNAVVLAGGRGTRLSPVTDTIPKPLAPIAGRSAFERILDLLADNGVTSAAVTVGYLAEKLKCISHDRVRLTFFEEKEPLGTAGGVRNAAEALEDCFIVISGDALCDFDLRNAVARHSDSGARVTVLLTRICDCSSIQEYGGVCLSPDGYITSFVEKPALSGAVSDLVNSGIYIMNKSVLSLIEEGKYCDFSRDLFPLLMKTERIQGLECDGYWCDIGDLNAFYRCNEDAFSGKLRMSGARSATGKNVVFGKGSKVFGSVVFDGVRVGENSTVSGSILCEGARIGDGCRVNSGCVVGAGAVLGDGVRLSKGTQISPGKRVGALFGDTGKFSLQGGVVAFETAGVAFALGSAAAQAFSSSDGNALVGVSGEKELSDALIAGVKSAGGTALAIENAGIPGALYVSGLLGLDCCLFAEREQVRIFDACGLSPTRERERAIIAAINGFAAKKGIKKSGAGVIDAEKLYKRYLGALGAVGDALAHGVAVTRDGTSIVSDRYPFPVLLALCLTEASERGVRTFALPSSLPLALGEYLASRGLCCVRYPSTPPDSSSDGARMLASGQRWLRDGNVLASYLASYLERTRKTLDIAASEIPFSFSSSTLDIESDTIVPTVRKLTESEGGEGNGDGIRVKYSNGSVVVVPSVRGFRIYAEAANAEAAAELCDLTAEKIERLRKKPT